ncbi:MAG: ThuA domain-containing protein [Planctomycetes bacterium]|nr:ThuA domain-containing protein [Planctomycetota bacterium]
MRAARGHELSEKSLYLLANVVGASDDVWVTSVAYSLAMAKPVEAMALAMRASALQDFWDRDSPQLFAAFIGRTGDVELQARAVVAIDATKAPAVGRRTATLRALVENLRGNQPPRWTPELEAALRSLVRFGDLELGGLALGLVSGWDRDRRLAAELPAFAQRLEEGIALAEYPFEARVTFLGSLFRIPEYRAGAADLAESMLSPELTPQHQQLVIDVLGRTDDGSAAGVLARRFTSLAPAAREQAFTCLVRRAKWVEPLLAEIEFGRIVPNDLGPLRISQLRNHGDASVAARARAVFEKLQGAQNLKTEELIAKVLPIVEQPGDAVRGKDLFQQNCATCHTYHGEGAKIGPDLTGMGSHGARALLPVILDPNASVEAAYLEHVCETTDERLITGIIVRDTPQSVVLRSTSGDTEIPRDEIVALKSTGRSPMPVGLESIGPEGLRDVLAYLTDEFSGFRVLDLREHFNMSSHKGMYDPDKAPDRMDLLRSGVIDVDGVPFELRDPAKSEGGRNALCLRGGMNADWFSRTGLPKKVAIPVGFALERMHVLGGIAAWGFPIRDDKQPCVRWTWVYADGSREEVVLHDGVEFADWIGRRDVPGSKYVEDLVKPGSWGQIRTFDLAPGQRKVVAAVEIESYDNHLSPTFFGLTAELAGAVRKTSVREVEPLDVLVVGGGSSHDFASFFRDVDLATLAAQGIASARYTEGTGELLSHLPMLKTLCLTNNQPLAGEALRQALWKFFDGGGGLVLVHPATWFNWSDWPEFNARWVGGGARNHERFAEFEVRVVDPQHALARGVPGTFRIQDELYETALDPSARTHVVAVGKSLATGKEYPVLWTVERPKGRTACLTLGHDGAAHGSAAYQTLYVNAVRWTLEAR